jgi:cathepsin B
MLEDRLCIHSKGKVNVRLAPEDMVTCDYNNGGCNGGYLAATIPFLQMEGVVTESCKPYRSGVGINGFCQMRCSNLSEAYTKYYCKKGSHSAPVTAVDIQRELMTNGPLQVGFVVYQDFPIYDTGIYEVKDHTVAGGHAVKLIGWNHDAQDRLYWLCQNSWGPTWGEQGYFRIYAGEAAMGKIVAGCIPRV